MVKLSKLIPGVLLLGSTFAISPFVVIVAAFSTDSGSKKAVLPILSIIPIGLISSGTLIIGGLKDKC
jgi:hypothetical protein